MLNDNGGIRDDLMVTRRAGDLYLVVNGATKAADLAHLRAAGLDVTHRDDLALLALQGPQAVTALDRLVPGVGDLRFMRAGPFAWDGTELWISRSGYTGEDGFEISLPSVRAEAFAASLLDQSEVRPVGLGARDSLRLEAGLPLYGHDLTPETTPVEAGLAFAVSKRRRSEGGFPGATRILAELAAGPARRRVGLAIDGRQPVREGAAVIVDDAVAGRGDERRLRPGARVADRDGVRPRRRQHRRHAAAGRGSRASPRCHRRADAVFPQVLCPRSRRMTLYFTTDHEWVAVEGAIGTVGVTDYAQGQLGDVVFVEVPAPGTSVTKGTAAAVVELVKAASDVYSPVSGAVTAANADLEAEPALVNTDPEGRGWFFKLTLSDPGELAGLMDAAAYKTFVAGL